MFKQRNEPTEPGGSADVRREPAGLRADPPPPAAPRKSGSSVVGPSILVQGDMTGDEDLVIQGRVEGSISLKKNLVTIGKDGRVNATVTAQSIRVEGAVEGELRGREQVIVTRTGSVSGNIVAPRVTLEDGCRFKGAIDMEGSDAGGAGKVTDIMLGASVADDPGKKS